MTPINREVLPLLQRAATELSGAARAASRHPTQLYRMTAGHGLNWTINAYDLFHVLDRCGLQVTVKPRR